MICRMFHAQILKPSVILRYIAQNGAVAKQMIPLLLQQPHIRFYVKNILIQFFSSFFFPLTLIKSISTIWTRKITTMIQVY